MSTGTSTSTGPRLIAPDTVAATGLATAAVIAQVAAAIVLEVAAGIGAEAADAIADRQTEIGRCGRPS